MAPPPTTQAERTTQPEQKERRRLGHGYEEILSAVMTQYEQVRLRTRPCQIVQPLVRRGGVETGRRETATAQRAVRRDIPAQ